MLPFMRENKDHATASGRRDTAPTMVARVPETARNSALRRPFPPAGSGASEEYLTSWEALRTAEMDGELAEDRCRRSIEAVLIACTFWRKELFGVPVNCRKCCGKRDLVVTRKPGVVHAKNKVNFILLYHENLHTRRVRILVSFSQKT